MKILWLSENGMNGKIPRDFEQMRTEFAWFVASDGEHYNIGEILNLADNTYDIAIIILPKREEILQQMSTYNGFDLIGQMKRVAKKIGWMQEGPVNYYQDYSIQIQMWWVSVLKEMDFLMVHNEKDRRYIQGFYEDKKVFVNQSLMIEDAINKKKINAEMKIKDDVMIGGNFCGWYGGFDSYMVATIFNKEIFVPSMGRMKEEEKYLDGISHVNYLSWKHWISALAGIKYAVHLMPVQAAGTFALNCAYLGIPCIGYRGLDTQQNLHPSLSVDIHDITKAKELAKKLLNADFYKKCSVETKQLYAERYTEKIWKTNFFNFLEHI